MNIAEFDRKVRAMKLEDKVRQDVREYLTECVQLTKDLIEYVGYTTAMFYAYDSVSRDLIHKSKAVSMMHGLDSMLLRSIVYDVFQEIYINE